MQAFPYREQRFRDTSILTSSSRGGIEWVTVKLQMLRVLNLETLGLRFRHKWLEPFSNRPLRRCLTLVQRVTQYLKMSRSFNVATVGSPPSSSLGGSTVNLTRHCGAWNAHFVRNHGMGP